MLAILVSIEILTLLRLEIAHSLGDCRTLRFFLFRNPKTGRFCENAVFSVITAHGRDDVVISVSTAIPLEESDELFDAHRRHEVSVSHLHSLLLHAL